MISREVRFIEIGPRTSRPDGKDKNGQDARAPGVTDWQITLAGDAPYLDYRPPTTEEAALIKARLDLTEPGEAAAQQARQYAIRELAPHHLAEVRTRREALIDKTLQAVHQRLTKEINYWDRRALEFKAQEREGKRNAKLNWQQAQQRADRLQERLDRRKRELEEARQISAAPPVIVGRALIVPIGLLLDAIPQLLLDRRITEQIAMQAVMAREIALGHHPRDVSADKLGYDIESRDGNTGLLRFLEVKGRRAGAETVTVTHNEILKGLNSDQQYALVLVEVTEGARTSRPSGNDETGRMHTLQAKPPCYVWKPPFREPGRLEVSVAFDLQELLVRSTDR
ncbi:MAG: DUF3883 domain-containing protein [Caldilineaceae bacterium]